MESLLLLCLSSLLLETVHSGRHTVITFNEHLSGPCNIENFETQKIEFKRKQIALDPPSPRLPGSFRIMANTSVWKQLDYVGAELELRLGDWESEPLPCQDQPTTKNCGGKGSCSVCEFCDSFKNLSASVIRNGIAVNAVKKNACPVKPGDYQISADVDVKDDNFFSSHLPTDLLDDLSGGKDRSIALYTTLWIYGHHFNDIDPNNRKGNSDLLNQFKKKWLVGCYRIVSTLKDVPNRS